MPRYFFDTADGDNDVDASGVELDSDDEAILEAIRYAGSMMSDDPSTLTTSDHFMVEVRRAPDSTLGKIEIRLAR